MHSSSGPSCSYSERSTLHTFLATLDLLVSAIQVQQHRLPVRWDRKPVNNEGSRIGISLIANALRSYVHLATDSGKHHVHRPDIDTDGITNLCITLHRLRHPNSYTSWRSNNVNDIALAIGNCIHLDISQDLCIRLNASASVTMSGMHWVHLSDSFIHHCQRR